MTQVTQLRPGVVPGAYVSMAGLTRPYLGEGTPLLPVLEAFGLGTMPTEVRDDTRMTGLVAGAKPAAYYAIADKDATTEFTYAASDTYLVYVQLSNTQDVTLALTDTYRPVLTFGGTVTTAIASSDTYTPVLTLAVKSIVKASPTLVSRGDTYIPVLTLAGTVTEAIASTDTYVPVLALSSISVEQADIKAGTDTYLPVLSMSATLIPNTSSVVPAADTYTVVLTFEGTPQTVARDVDRIVGSLRPRGVITGRWT